MLVCSRRRAARVYDCDLCLHHHVGMHQGTTWSLCRAGTAPWRSPEPASIHGTPSPSEQHVGNQSVDAQHHDSTSVPPVVRAASIPSHQLITRASAAASEQRGAAVPTPSYRSCGCRTATHPNRGRLAPSPAATRHFASNAETSAGFWEHIRMQNIDAALGRVGLALPAHHQPRSMGSPY